MVEERTEAATPERTEEAVPSGAATVATPAPAAHPAAPAGHAAGPRPRRRFGKDRYVPKRKVCAFCADKVKEIDYKEVGRLRRYLSERGKIEPRRKTGTCARHQRALTVALKRARHVALLPFTAAHGR